MVVAKDRQNLAACVEGTECRLDGCVVEHILRQCINGCALCVGYATQNIGGLTRLAISKCSANVPQDRLQALNRIINGLRSSRYRCINLAMSCDDVLEGCDARFQGVKREKSCVYIRVEGDAVLIEDVRGEKSVANKERIAKCYSDLFCAVAG